jgi:hypothetical protein
MKLFGSISKVSENPDNTLTVTGICSSEAKDSDGEIIKASAIEAAIPDFLKFPALREMHQNIAAGTTLALEVLDSGVTQIEALVVDPVSIKKVLTGVLKGFSIGGKVTKRNDKQRNIIEGITLTEISLVDRPANPDSVIQLYKSETIGDEPDNQGEEEMDTEIKTPERTEETMEKSLYSISDLACVLQYAKHIHQSAELEYDNKIPQDLATWIKSGIGILQSMSEEEIKNLNVPAAPVEVEAEMPEQEETQEAEKADMPKEDMPKEEEQKAEDEMMNISKNHYEMLQEVYKIMHKMFGAEESTKAESNDDLHKMQSEISVLKSELQKKDQDLQNLIDESTKAIKAVQAKGYLKAVAVSKEEDGIVKSDNSQPKSTLDLLKASFAAGKRINL